MSLPQNLEQMHLGELEQLARQHGIQVSPEWRKEDVIRALRSQTGVMSGEQIASQASGQRDDPRPPGTSPEEWKNIPGNQS